MSDTFGNFSLSISPLFERIKILQQIHSELSNALSEYQTALVNVRHEETEQNIEIERECILKFSALFQNFISESNSFRVSISVCYNSSFINFSKELRSIGNSLEEFLSTFNEFPASEEELELDQYIIKEEPVD